MKKSIRILHLEDSQYDAELIHSILETGGIISEVTRVDSHDDFVAALEQPIFDLIISDYSLPSFDGLSALTLAHETAPDVPFIFVSAAIGEERAIDSLKRGATDYVLKQRLSRLVPAVSRALHEREERAKLLLAQRALHETQQRFRAIVETSQDWIWEIDNAGRTTFSNSSIQTILGYSPEEIIGQDSLLYIHEEDKRKIELTLKSSTTEHRGWTGLLLRWQHKDGTYRWIESNATPILDERNQVIGFRGVYRDITERIKSEQKLRESEERFRLITENVNDLIALVDLNGRRIYNSPSYQTILGDPTALRGTDSFQNIHPDDRESIVATFRETVKTGVGRRAEYRMVGNDGIARFIESQGSLVRNQEGNPASVVVVSRDVTKRKKLEEQLLHAQKMESIGTLAGGIAHDFNNVLAIILGYASLLGGGPVEPERLTKSVAAMTKAVERGTALVRQLLTFARKSEVLFSPVAVNEITEEVAKMCSQTFPKRITFSTHYDKHAPPIIADRNQLHQAFLNLCVNARDAMPERGTLSIRTAVTHGSEIRSQFLGAEFDQYVHVSVSDTGIGMDAATQARIFEPFFTTKDVGKGTGLGLAMVYGVVNSHRGFIDVKSEVGTGTTFHLYFPVPPPGSRHLPFQEAVIDHVVGGTETILFAEDEDTLAELAKILLEQSGYRILLAKDGFEAVEIFRKHAKQIDLVVTDLELPKLGGWNAFLKMRELQPTIISIVCSGFIDPESRSGMLNNGARDFIDKPYAPNQLLKKVRDALDSRRPPRYTGKAS